MKQIFFLIKSKKLANEILYYFRVMLLFEIYTLLGQKMKKRLFLIKNYLSWAKNQKSYLKYGHLFADCGL